MTSIRFFVVLTVLTYSQLAVAQKVDSLQAVLDTAKNEYKVKTLNEFFRSYLQSDPVKAVGYAREAMSYATEVGDKKGLAAAYNNMGVAYRTQGSLDKALEYYMTALNTYVGLDNKEGIATTRNNIATIYSMKKDYDQAMKYLNESYAIFSEMKDSAKIIGSLNNLGNIHLEMQMYEKALEYYKEAYDMAEKTGLRMDDALNNLGNLNFRQKNFHVAEEYYQKALQEERAADDKLGVLNVLTNLSMTYMKEKQSKLAQQTLDEAFALCDQIQGYSYLPALYRTQAENYANQAMWKNAYETELKYDEAREMVFGVESTRNIAQMELRVSLHEKEKEMEILKHQDEIKSLELHNTRLIIFTIILAGMLLIGILNYVFLTKKKVIHGRPVNP